MNLAKPIVTSLVVCGLTLLFAVASFGAEAGGANGAGTATEVFKWINFAIVAVALIWVFAKKLPPVFRSNAQNISSAITKAAAAKAEADRQLTEAEQRLSRLAEEVKAIRDEALQDAAAEAERIRALAKSDIEKVGLAAKAEIAAAERAARLELKVLTAQLAVDQARGLVAKQLTPQTQDALVSGFVESLEGSAD
jgi:F-type H+-transporting ATPase subunit b